MKRSEIYRLAILAVIDYIGVDAEEKFEAIERLMTDRNLAKMIEENEEDKF